MSRQRRNFSAKFKSDLIIELLKGGKDLNTLAVENNIQPNLLRCQTAHCGRHKLHFDFGGNTFPTVLYRHSPQALCGLTADCHGLRNVL